MTRRRGILMGLIGLMLVACGGLAVFMLLQRTLLPRQVEPTAVPPPTVSVVVTTREITEGTMIRAGDVAAVEVPVDIAPSGAVSSIEQAINRMTKVTLVDGEMVMGHNLADPTNVQRDLAFTLSDDQVLMAFPVNELMGQLNLLERGDLVDILVSIEQEVEPIESGPLTAQETQEPETMLFTFDALQRVTIAAVVVEVLGEPEEPTVIQEGEEAIQEAQGTPEPTPMPPPEQVESQALLLALNPQDALVLKHLKDDGGIFDIVIRAPTSTQLFDLDPVMPEYLIDRYELEVTR